MKNVFETNSEKDRATAGRALRGSAQIAEIKREQSQSITKMQIQTMDHLTGAWDERMKLPIPKTVSPSALLSELKSYCRPLSRRAVGHTGRLFQTILAAVQKQRRRAGAEAMTSWAKTAKPPARTDRRSP